MILICDCGSTKAEWVLLDGNNVVKRFITNGFNPNYTDNETIENIVGEAKNIIDNQDVTKVFFYGSGCGSEANKIKVAMIMAIIFKIGDIEVYPDTLGACHALFGGNAGVACILGTGSNLSSYDGEKITENLVSLGFMIGDEGSGCHIGKRIVHDYFYKIMPDDLRMKFDDKYHLDTDTFLKRVYNGDTPSKYLAEFAKFGAENVYNQYIIDVIGGCFDDFVKVLVRLKRSDIEKLSVGFVGSIACAFNEILLHVLENHNIGCVKILKNPMDGLIEYYMIQNEIASLSL